MPTSTKTMYDDDLTIMTATTESSLSFTLFPAARPTKVKFQLRANKIYPITHIEDMEEDLVRSIWYEKRDYDGIKNKLIPDIRKLMKGEEVPESNRSTARGLEYRTRKGALKRQSNKQEGTSAVMMEQRRQRDENIRDDELLAEVFRGVSSHCQDSAYALALRDEAFVRNDLDKMRKKTSEVYPPARSQSSDSTKSFKSRGINGLLKQVIRRRQHIPEQIAAAQPGRIVLGTAATA